MLEVNAIYLILLTEGFGLTLLILLFISVFTWLGRRRRRRVLGQLAIRIRERAQTRLQATESFLQTVYRLEGEALHQAVACLEHRENAFFQILIDALYHGGAEQIAGLDNALNELTEAYEYLEPRPPNDPEADPLAEQVQALLGENENLREELSVAHNTMSQMVAEFVELFGGGRDNELTIEQIMAKITASKPDTDTAEFEIETSETATQK